MNGHEKLMTSNRELATLHNKYLDIFYFILYAFLYLNFDYNMILLTNSYWYKLVIFTIPSLLYDILSVSIKSSSINRFDFYAKVWDVEAPVKGGSYTWCFGVLSFLERE